MKKFLEKSIAPIAVILALLGFISMAIPYNPRDKPNIWSHLKQFFDTLGLDSNFHLGIYFKTDIAGVNFSVLSLCLYLVLLIGGIKYWKNRSGVRLLLFSFALIFIGRVFAPLHVLSFWLFTKSNTYGPAPKPEILQYALGFAYQITLALISYFIIKHLSYAQSPKLIAGQKMPDEGDNLAHSYLAYQKTDKLTRFFHFVLDTLLATITVSVPGLLLGYAPIMDRLSRTTNNRYTMLLLAIGAARLLYYLVFEGVFRTTPAKMLSGTKVYHHSGEDAGFLTIFGRTLCRFIPFEAFSFFGNTGWHDRLSETSVYKLDKPTAYFHNNWLFIIGLLSAAFLLRVMPGRIVEAKEDAWSDEQYKLDVQQKKKEIQSLSNGDIILMTDKKYIHNAVLVDTIIKDMLLGTMVQDTYQRGSNLHRTTYVDSLFIRYKTSQAFEVDIHKILAGGSYTANNFTIGDNYYHIKRIRKYKAPTLSAPGGGSFSGLGGYRKGDITISLLVHDEPITIEQIEVLEGDCHIEATLPEIIALIPGTSFGRYEITLSKTTRLERYRLRLTTRDTHGVQRVYSLRGMGTNTSLAIEK